MTGIIDWAASRARMIIAFVMLSLIAGGAAYIGLPKEGEPDIEIPALFVSVPFPGISAEDAETLLVRPMETELADLDGLKSMSATAAEGYAGMALEFEFGWDKTRIMADVRDAMNNAEGQFPNGADTYSINELNFSEFPIIIVNLTGDLPERTLIQVAKDLQDRLESIDAVLEASITGQRDEMVEVVIDPLRLEAYNVTAAELIGVVSNNNLLIAAGTVETEQGAFAVKIPSSFDEPRDIYDLPVKVEGDRVVTLGDLATIRLTFEDRASTARYNGETTIALQVVKRKGFNLIDTAAAVREAVAAEEETWAPELRQAINVGTSNDQSREVGAMVGQLEGSVLTAIALVMIVVLAALGLRPALLVGFAIPTSFLLCFALLAVMGITISNIVMFGLILAVGMLVDGAIVVVEYADRRVQDGAGPMQAFTEAAKRMFWPVVSSTATTLCAFLPMLFWPGVPGQFMGMLPVTLIFVLSASLVVALIYLPVLGGVIGRLAGIIERIYDGVKYGLPRWVRMILVVPALAVAAAGVVLAFRPGMFGPQPVGSGWLAQALPGLFLFAFGVVLVTLTLSLVSRTSRRGKVSSGYKRSAFGSFIGFLTGNPIMPLVTVGLVIVFVMGTFGYFGQNNNGVEFFVETEPEQSIVYVQARGNLSISEKDRLVRQAEDQALQVAGIRSVFAFAGAGGLNQNTAGAGGPADAIGQLQIEMVPWEERSAYARDNDLDIADLGGNAIMAALQERLDTIPGIRTEILNLAQGPGASKPIHLRLIGNDWDDLETAAVAARAQFEATPALRLIEDTLPLPGIDWQIDVDVEAAGRYGADVATVGAMVQLVTRGVMLGQMRVDSSDEQVDIRVRLPQEDRVLSTLDSLRVRTPSGLIPLSNFITRTPVARLAEINRVDQQRYYDVLADARPGFVNLTFAQSIDEADADADTLALLERMRAGEDLTLDDTLTDAPTTEEELLSETLASVLVTEIDAATALGAPNAYDLAVTTPQGFPLSLFVPDQVAYFDVVDTTDPQVLAQWQDYTTEASRDAGITATKEIVNPNERIERLTEWLDTDPLPASVSWEWTGDQEDQAESGAFLANAFMGALGLMFIILLAQFNSVYNSILVLLAVILSTTGVLIGMLVMDQAFSIIMTGTGIVALAGIVVNNNIVLIDTYQEYSAYMPRTEAVARTAQDRIRPVLLTTITTMAGLAPMMFGLSLNFINGGYTIDAPTALWWKQLATAVVFGLGIATVLTLVFTPSMLALRIWATTYAVWGARVLAALSFGRASQSARDWATDRKAARIEAPTLIWEEPDEPFRAPPRQEPLRAAE